MHSRQNSSCKFKLHVCTSILLELQSQLKEPHRVPFISKGKIIRGFLYHALLYFQPVILFHPQEKIFDDQSIYLILII